MLDENVLNYKMFKDTTSDEYIVRHRKDETGDYTMHYYDVIAVMKYGGKTVCSDIENPYDASMFANAPDMIKEILSLREKIDFLMNRINVATRELTSSENNKLEGDFDVKI